jgi:hypothetical protein
MRRGILFIVAVLLCLSVFSQATDTVVKDSARVYKKIENFSNRHRATQLLYGLVFRPVNPKPVEEPAKVKKAPVYYQPYEGKIIRKIVITTFDPFGYDSHDTSVTPKNALLKAGNGIHIKTRNMIIRNLLLFHPQEPFDSLKVRESERLIRGQRYVREVYFTPVMDGESVDIYIREYDVWSIIITGAFSPSSFSVDLNEKNFLGLGHQFDNHYSQDLPDAASAFELNYSVANIYNTHVNSLVHYTREGTNYNEYISLDRPFYSSLTKWAGGIYLGLQKTKEEWKRPDSTAYMQLFRQNTQDYWIGHAWQLERGRSEEKRTTSLIASLRYSGLHYMERAPSSVDTLMLHANEDLYIGSIGLAKRNYKRDNYIFKYGYDEDVPTGRAVSLVIGSQRKNMLTRPYLGWRVYMANYHAWGYFNIYLEYGTYFHNDEMKESNFTGGVNCFTNIMHIGRWKFRQFIKPQFTFGYNRLDSDNLSLNSENGIKGFNSTGLSGTKKLLLTLQLQSYPPWKLIGFRFGPFLICSFGMLGNDLKGFDRSPVYSAFGLGILIKNEYLLISTFQISAAFYPSIPGVGNSILKMNPVKSGDFGFRGFDISRPSMISYQ